MQINLVFIRKDGTIQQFDLPSAVTFLGRRQDCDMCIPLSVVSRRHCELFTEYGKLFVRDLKSRNGTFVNGKAVEETHLKAGDELMIGPVKFIVQINGVPESFESYLPEGVEPKMATAATEAKPPQEEPKEAEMEDISEEMDQIAGQSQTMDIDSIFSNDFSEQDDFDLDSDIP